MWTLEQKGLKPTMNISFDEAVPTKTHMALKKLVDASEYDCATVKQLGIESNITVCYLSPCRKN